MFCAVNENKADAVDNSAIETGDIKSGSKWSIPGAQMPVASMIHSWLATCQAGWPIIKVGEGDPVPHYFERASREQSIILDGLKSETGKREYDMPTGNESPNDEKGPPANIDLPVKMDSSFDAKGALDNGFETRNETFDVQFCWWGDVVDVSRIDWWYTLRVLRDCSDLVLAGWCPPPSDIGSEIILSLISIAEQGLGHLSGTYRTQQEMTEQQIRKERLVACSCASESLAALKNLASRDAIPHEALEPLVTSLCRLLSAAETTISALPSNVSDQEQVEDANFDNTAIESIVTAQKEIRTFVASNSAEILWVLLSNEGTACPTIDALLYAIDVNLSLVDSDTRHEILEEDVLAAGGAIRALSAALWGEKCFLLIVSVKQSLVPLAY